MKLSYKLASLALALSLVFGFSLAAAPQAEAFTLFGVRFFEKNRPTPTPTATPTPTPSPTPVPEQKPDQNGQVLGETGKLPETGPEASAGLILLGVTGAFVARKMLQVGHNL